MDPRLMRGDRVAGKVAVVMGAGWIAPSWSNGKAIAFTLALVREDPDDVGASLHLLVQALDRFVL